MCFYCDGVHHFVNFLNGSVDQFWFLQKGSHFAPTLLIQHDNHDLDQSAALNTTLDKLRNQAAPVLAILAGAETGVLLAERFVFTAKMCYIFFD